VCAIASVAKTKRNRVSLALFRPINGYEMKTRPCEMRFSFAMPEIDPKRRTCDEKWVLWMLSNVRYISNSLVTNLITILYASRGGIVTKMFTHC
jgi:hypothetical protein